MKVYQCTKCGGKNVYVDEISGESELYCGDCGRWIKQLSKNESKLIKKQIEKMKNKDI